MKAQMPKCYDQLKPSEKARIEAAIFDRLDEELCTAQIIWIKMGCCALAENGSSVDEIILWIGAWKRLYRANSRFKNQAEQTAFLDKRMKAIFGEDGFPEDFVQSFREIGR